MHGATITTESRLGVPPGHTTVLSAALLLAAGVVAFSVVFAPLALQRFLIPALVMALAGLMLWLRPSWYVAFVWWVWIMTPLVRRLLDWKLGFVEVNPILVSPLAVTGLSVIPLLGRHALLRQRQFLPFLVLSGALLLAYGIGLARFGVFGPTFKLMEYLAPALFGLYLATREDPLDRSFRPVLIALLVAGGLSAVYGIIQFFWITPWDQYWMTASNTYLPREIAPGEFRIFGTINSTHPFGYVMVAGLITALGSRHKRALLLAAPLIAALLLSWTRAAWGTWVLAMGVAFLLSTGQARAIIGRTVVAAAVAMVLLVSAGPLGSRIATRMDTIASLGDDGSLQHRTNLYLNRSLELLATPVGTGLGSSGKAAKLTVGQTFNIDSAYLTLPYELGWGGAFLFLAAVGSLVGAVLVRPSRRDARYVALAGGIVGMLAAGLFGNVFGGVQAMIFWTFLGLCYGEVVRRADSAYPEAT